MVHKLGVGPPPVPVDALKTKHLVAALGFMHQPEVTALAAEVAASISKVGGSALSGRTGRAGRVVSPGRCQEEASVHRW